MIWLKEHLDKLDRERGIVLSMGTFCHSGTVPEVTLSDGRKFNMRFFSRPSSILIFEAFKIEKGLIAQVEALGTSVPYGLHSGWPGGVSHGSTRSRGVGSDCGEPTACELVRPVSCWAPARSARSGRRGTRSWPGTSRSRCLAADSSPARRRKNASCARPARQRSCIIRVSSPSVMSAGRSGRSEAGAQGGGGDGEVPE